MRYPDDNITIIVLSNYSGAASAQQPARALEAVVFGEKPEPPRLALGETIYGALKNGQVDAKVENLDELVARGGYEIRRPFELNNLGYELLGEDDIEMAIVVFELNLSHFPQDANCYDSLAEAHLAAGDRERAIALYRKALEIDPGFENSRRMLERLTTVDITPGM
jgi:tetratricopeptide (TPR) repeat protein